jgi:fatty acid amide hydrolase
MGREIWKQTAVELSEGLGQGEFSSEEVVQAHYDRIDAVNPSLNAMIHRFDDEALRLAKEADARREKGQSRGPLDGLPISIKESMATAGVPVTLGIENRRHEVAPRDSVVVQLLRERGVILLGKTNVPQLLLCHETDNKIWGKTLNPFHPERVPGGSSGGEAAAIASGMSPWGVGTDIGGSIRVPAAFCGISGLKPTVDRWSNLGSYTALMGQETVRGQCGPMARSAADVAFLFRALDSPVQAPLDPAVAPVATPDPSTVQLKGLRVGFYTDDGFFPAAASLARGVREAAKHLEDAGATVVEYTPAFQKELITLYYAALSSDGGVTIRERLRGDPLIPQLKLLMRSARLPRVARKTLAWGMGLKGEKRIERVLAAVGKKTIDVYWKLNARRSSMRLEALDAWDKQKLDLILCPAHATPALRHGDSADLSAAGSYSMRYNLLNFPCGVVPVTTVRAGETRRPQVTDRIEKAAAAVEEGSEGLPVGIQVVGRPFEEHRVLAAMIAIQDAAQTQKGYPHTPV